MKLKLKAMKLKYVAAAIAVPIILSGCATSQKVQVVQEGDQNLTCEQLTAAIDEVNAVTAKNDENKGMTGANVAAALFFWPALAYTYMDNSKAGELATDRLSHLTKLRNEKGC